MGDSVRMRVGRKLGRTIYVAGINPDDDPVVGMMDTPELAAFVVECVNERADRREREHDELAEAGRTIAEEYERQHGAPPLLKCPDDGTCHHDCATYAGPLRCWRVYNAEPLSGVFTGDRWPDGALPTIVAGENP